MARLQILELPSGADDDRPPFVLVIDEWDVDTFEANAMLADYWDTFGKKIGAQGVLFADRTIDIPANDTSGYLQTATTEPEISIKLGGHDLQATILDALRQIKDDPQAGLQ